MKKIKSELSLETITSIMTEEEIRDVKFCKEIIERALREQKKTTIRTLFEKATSVFLFEGGIFRRKLMETIYPVLKNLTLQEIIEIGRNTIPGNVVALYYFIQKYRVVKPDDISCMATLSTLEFINDPFMFEFVSSEKKLMLDLDERLAKTNEPEEISRSAKICEHFFFNELMTKNEETIKGMYILYENSELPEMKFKGAIVSSMLRKRLDIFMHSLNRISGNDVHSIEDIMANYTKIFGQLVKINIPVFFGFEYLRSNNVVYNGNFFFLKFLDMSGNEKLLFPFEQTELAHIQKIFDLNTRTYVTPKGRMGKIPIHEIFSFKGVAKVTSVSDVQVGAVKKLSEDEIEKKIRDILKDQNITSHGPAEKADIFTTKLLINNETDLRNSAFILKGKGYPKVYLRSIASNLLKAVELPVDIVFLVYIGTILDEAQEKFISQCNVHRKMYCAVGPVELTRLLVAYNKLG